LPAPSLAAEPAAAQRPIDPDRFIVIKPDKGNEVAGARPAAPANPPARVENKQLPVDLGIIPAEFPLAPMPEAGEVLGQGKFAFARAEYGVALECFRRAIALAPQESSSWFLLAQTQFAIGKYDEAAANIVEGMKRRPDWPASRYQSRDAYRLNPAAFDIQVQSLREAVAANPDDPRLLFLLAVELWFDDKRAEARPLFEMAAKLAKDSAPAQAFLRK
jgi:tetratricopeptide (TPR) repeat protein